MVIIFLHAMHSTTDPGDFIGVSQDGSVQSAGDGVCLLIFINNDNLVESCEEFSVAFTLIGTNINPRIIVARSEVTVTLFDDEGVRVYCTVLIYLLH